MSIALRKLAMLEKRMESSEEEAKLNGYTSCPIDKELKVKIEDLLERVRTI